ncbi:hypothetical protein [Rhodopirellula sp. P2]|uniref:hypothetical protein n=1 Tax=Rhodopirellula sp. P2 TaxID=2127060 RepID=UPI002368D0AF|nr:hypothetical protein [Rhodopirellula sp. P2]WDQ16933.1 hypothetical protein PSR62_25480 [Rhodopirellula sp. P2]
MAFRLIGCLRASSGVCLPANPITANQYQARTYNDTQAIDTALAQHVQPSSPMALARFRSLGTARSYSRISSHHFGNSPQVDASFYWNRLRRTAGLAVLLGIVNVLSGVSGPMKASHSTGPRDQPTLAELPPEPAAAQPPVASGPRAVPPVGWRRTINGWENVAEWPGAHNHLGGIPAQVSLSDQIILQEKREPAMLRHWMDKLRHTHPAVIASVQIVSVLILFAAWLAVREKPGRRLRSPRPPSQLVS